MCLCARCRCGCCVPRPQLLKRWLQAGVKMRQIEQNQLQLIYPETAHDYECECWELKPIIVYILGRLEWM